MRRWRNVTTETDIAWLAGILDGEGMIAFARRGKWSHQVKIAIKVTCPAMIGKVSCIFSGMGLKYSYSKEEVEGNKPKIRIQVNSSGGVEQVLSGCLPYLTTKRDEAVCMLEYLAWRRTLPLHTSNKSHCEAIASMQELTMQSLQDLKRRKMILEGVVLEPSTPLKLVK